MKIKLYQVDAFTHQLFGGNPAAVCPLENWLDDEVMQSIAFENNLSDTAFYVQQANGIAIRWFTPKVEVALCGHATLGAAHVLYAHEGFSGSEIIFTSKSGELKVKKEGEWLVLNFPADGVEESKIDVSGCFNTSPQKIYKGKNNMMVVFDSEEEVHGLVPNLGQIAQLPALGIIATAKGGDVDFVSRYFAPQSGIDEDPVTGSAHTTLIPYWGNVLGKTEMTARQISGRGGYLKCGLQGARVLIGGQAKTYMAGEIYL